MTRTNISDDDPTIDHDATLWDGLVAMFGRESFLSTKAKALAASILITGFVLIPLIKEAVLWALIGMGVPSLVVIGISVLFMVYRKGWI